MKSVSTFLCVALACASFVSSFTVKLQVTQDVTLERGSTNYNYLKYLIVGLHPNYPKKRSLVQFQNLPSSCDFVLSANLHIYYLYAHESSALRGQLPLTPRTIAAYRVSKSWKESEATSTLRYSGAYWSHPWLGIGTDTASYSLYTRTIDPRVQQPGFVKLDVTSSVQEWKAGYPNYGLLLMATDEAIAGRDFRFASNAYPDTSKHAYIQVECLKNQRRPLRPIGGGGVNPVK